MPGAARKPPPSRGARKFVQQQLDRAAEELPDLPPATVTATSPLTVLFLGSSLQLRRLAQYTPAVNDVVTLARSGGNWIVLGKTV